METIGWALPPGARAGIDGVKYPVNTMSGAPKDGDGVRFNYVSFRDDNIRVDHKWTDGQQRYSVRRLSDRRPLVVVEDIPQEIADAKSLAEKRRLAAKLIRERWMGKAIDPDGVNAFVNGKTSREYANPANEPGERAMRDKLDAAGELDSIVSASTRPRTVGDGLDGHTHGGVLEWEHRDALFKVGDRVYSGRVNIKVLEGKGANGENRRLLHDITKLKDITSEVMHLKGVSTAGDAGSIPYGGADSQGGEPRHSVRRDELALHDDPDDPIAKASVAVYGKRPAARLVAFADAIRRWAERNPADARYTVNGVTSDGRPVGVDADSAALAESPEYGRALGRAMTLLAEKVLDRTAALTGDELFDAVNPQATDPEAGDDEYGTATALMVVREVADALGRDDSALRKWTDEILERARVKYESAANDAPDASLAAFFGEEPGEYLAELSERKVDLRARYNRYRAASDDLWGAQGDSVRHSVTQGRGDAPDPQREYDEVVARFTNEDGTRKPGWMEAPNGEPTNLTERQWVQVRTPAFKRWFGDWEGDPANASKVVDENGEPLVVYHATDNAFTVFDRSRLGENTDRNAGDEAARQMARLGFWFNEKDLRGETYQDRTVAAYADVKNPYETTFDEMWDALSETSHEEFIDGLNEEGYDGIVLEDTEFGGRSFVLLSPEQIKSATENTGEFSPNVDIRYSVTRVPQEGVGRNDAVASINLLKGRTFTNRETGIEARLSSTGAGKLISNKAVAKSVANGFTPAQHNALAAQIDRLYEGAILVEERPDRGGDINIRSIRRFLHPVRIGEAEAGAYITVKESVEHGNRIYSVEGIRIAALPPTVRRAIADHNSADSAAYADTIAYLPPEAQAPTPDAFVRDAVMGMLAAADGGKGAANAGGACQTAGTAKRRMDGGCAPKPPAMRAWKRRSADGRGKATPRRRCEGAAL